MEKRLEFEAEVFQNLVKFYGETFNLPPLSAKIYAYLIFDFDKQGVSFEDFIEVFSASKSSVSANVNLLLNAKLITDFNKIHGRKRYFLLNENYIILRFEEIIAKMKREIEILDQLNEFRKTTHKNSNPRFEIYKTLLNNNILNIQETLLKL